MATVAGLRGTGDWSVDERPKNFREMILRLQPNGETPLTALLSKMGSESVDDPEFNWWEEPYRHVRLKVNGAQTSVDTAIEVEAENEAAALSGAFGVVAGDVLLLETASGLGEKLFVTANPTTDTGLTVSRGASGTTAAAIADDAILLKVSSAFAEGTFAPKATFRNPTKLFNLCQIFKTPYDLTVTATKTYTRTGDPLKNDKNRKTFAHARDMENAFLWGTRFETVGTNGKPQRFTGGLNSFLTTNRTVYTTANFNGGGIDSFLDLLSPLFNVSGEGASSDERIMLLGNTALNTINKAVKSFGSTRINFDNQVTKVYGMNLHRLVIPQGALYLKSHPLLNINPTFSGSAFVINPRGLTYRYVRDTQEQDNIQANDEDVRRGQWLTECGLEVHHETTMAYFGNIF